MGAKAPSPKATPITAAPWRAEPSASSMAIPNSFSTFGEEGLGMVGHDFGHRSCLVIREPIFLQEVGQLGLDLSSPPCHLLSLLRDLGQGDLPVALAGKVLTRSHAED